MGCRHARQFYLGLIARRHATLRITEGLIEIRDQFFGRTVGEVLRLRLVRLLLLLERLHRRWLLDAGVDGRMILIDHVPVAAGAVRAERGGPMVDGNRYGHNDRFVCGRRFGCRRRRRR